MKTQILDSEYLAFVSVLETGYCNNLKPMEKTYKAYGHYCQVVFVSKAELEGFKTKSKTKFPSCGLFGARPATLGFSHTSPEDRRKALGKFSGFPKFNFGLYYSPDHLLFLDDVMNYGYSRLTYAQIRTARDIILGNKYHKD